MEQLSVIIKHLSMLCSDRRAVAPGTIPAYICYIIAVAAIIDALLRYSNVVMSEERRFPCT